jgi:hypothetical protein
MSKRIKISMNANFKSWLKAAKIYLGIMLFFCVPVIINDLFGQEVTEKIVFGGLGLGAAVVVIWIIKMWINDE